MFLPPQSIFEHLIRIYKNESGQRALITFPVPVPHNFTKAEINALYFATHRMKRPRGWNVTIPVGRYWRAALVVFFNYGVDSGTIWRTRAFHEPVLWRHVWWDRPSPDREVKEKSPWEWLFYRRLKTNKAFYRPMNRTVHLHIKSSCRKTLIRMLLFSFVGGTGPTVDSGPCAAWRELAPRRT